MKSYLTKDIESDKLLQDHILENDNLTDPKIIDQELMNLFSTEEDCSALLQNITANEHFENFIVQQEQKDKYLEQTQFNDFEQCSEIVDLIGATLGENETNIERPNKDSEELKWSCDFCPKRFKRRSDLTLHKKSHGESFYECEICCKKFTQKSHLTIHRKRHLSDYIVYCKPCNKGFYTKCSYRNHLNVTHNSITHNCDICGCKLSTKSALKEHQKTHEKRERTEICEICGKTFLSGRNLRNHLKIHIHSGNYCCKICGKIVSDKKTLDVHVRTHTGEKPLKCDVCEKTFASKSYMRAHLRTHTGIKPYTCVHCDKKFSQKSSLNIHVRYHTGQRPYGCSMCGKNFVSRTHLNGHMKTHDFAKEVDQLFNNF